MLNICTRYLRIPLTVLNVREGIRFLYKSGYNCQFTITKGYNYTRNVGGDMVLVLCTLSQDDLYLYQNL